MLKKWKKEYGSIACRNSKGRIITDLKLPLSYIFTIKKIARKEKISFNKSFLNIIKLGLEMDKFNKELDL